MFPPVRCSSRPLLQQAYTAAYGLWGLWVSLFSVLYLRTEKHALSGWDQPKSFCLESSWVSTVECCLVRFADFGWIRVEHVACIISSHASPYYSVASTMFDMYCCVLSVISIFISSPPFFSFYIHRCSLQSDLGFTCLKLFLGGGGFSPGQA